MTNDLDSLAPPFCEDGPDMVHLAHATLKASMPSERLYDLCRAHRTSHGRAAIRSAVNVGASMPRRMSIEAMPNARFESRPSIAEGPLLNDKTIHESLMKLVRSASRKTYLLRVSSQ